MDLLTPLHLSDGRLWGAGGGGEVLVSPLTRALSTALVALRDHPAMSGGGGAHVRVRLVRHLREVGLIWWARYEGGQNDAPSLTAEDLASLRLSVSVSLSLCRSVSRYLCLSVSL